MALSELTQAQKDDALSAIESTKLTQDEKDLLSVLVTEAKTIEGGVIYELGTANFSTNLKQVYNYASKNGITQLDSLRKGA